MIALGILDYIFIAIILIAVVRCVFRGFVAEIIAVAAIGGGILCGILFSSVVGELIARGLGESSWNRVIAFLLIFLFVYLILKILEGILYRMMDSVNLENLDRALAFFLGLAEGAIVCLLVLLVLLNQPFFDTRELIDSSYIAGLAARILPVFQGNNLLPTKVLQQGV